MNKKILIRCAIAVITLIILFACYFVGSGFAKSVDVALYDYTVSEDGTEITLNTFNWSSMGFTRGFKDNGGGEKPHYLIFYSTFGGLNSRLGAKSEHILTLGKDDSEIYFNRAGGGYQLVLQKDKDTGEWVRP